MINKYYSLDNNLTISEFGEISSALYEEKKSKFYSYIFKITSEKDAIEKIERIKKERKDARHVVYIYSIKENAQINIRFSDDGEPQGTGTRAIYDTLEKEKITNICVVIVRYFGGILLGAGPLSRAYLKAYKEGLNNCTKCPIYEFYDLEITNLLYNEYEALNSKLKVYIGDKKLSITNIIYGEKVGLKLNIREDIFNEVKDIITKYNKK